MRTAKTLHELVTDCMAIVAREHGAKVNRDDAGQIREVIPNAVEDGVQMTATVRDVGIGLLTSAIESCRDETDEEERKRELREIHSALLRYASYLITAKL